ncbi:MAG: factor-independent urate hydroxylase [Acidimicrobiia bacterium]
MGVAELGPTGYGKSAVRLMKVIRADPHTVKDISVDIRLEGDFTDVHLSGDNRLVLPTDTMKNTVYCLARDVPFEEIEELGLALARHFSEENRHVSKVAVHLVEHLWDHISAGEEPHRHAFLRRDGGRRKALVTTTPKGTSVEAGLEGLALLKTTGSAFSGFRRDRFTTLEETEERLLATAIDAAWSYLRPNVDHGPVWNGTRRALLEAFATHEGSRSLQHTAYVMGAAALEASPEIAEIRLILPNKHHVPVDLSPFGLDNPDEVFTPTEQPYGLVEVTVRRSGGSRES